jgi:hypothetical protein
MVDDFADRNLQGVFVYVREAHPGEHYPHHDSFERKLHHARVFREHIGVRRPILVDALDGTAHLAFGAMPNMTYVLNRGHNVVFRANWTDPPTIRFAVDYLFDVEDRRREGRRLNPFYAELHGFRWVDDEAFFRDLVMAGPKAVREFAEARERWARGEHLGQLRNKTQS